MLPVPSITPTGVNGLRLLSIVVSVRYITNTYSIGLNT